MNFLMFLNKLSTIGQWMTSRLLLVSLEVTAFALIVWIVLKVVRFRSARVRKALWLIVLFKMVFSLFIGLPISLSFTSDQSVTSEPISEFLAPPVGQDIRQQPQSIASSPSVSSFPQPKSSQTDFATDESTWLWQFDWQQLVAIVWLFGCGLMLGRLALGLRMIGKLRNKIQPTCASRIGMPERLQNTLRSCQEQLKIRSTVELQLSDNIAVPILFGFWRPVIVLPSWCVDQFSRSELRLMLMHELAHWKYRDTCILLAKRIIEAIFFFHPAIWYAGKQVIKESEAACDELVITLSQESKSYANCLIQILQREVDMKKPALGGLAVGGTATADRVRKILEEGSRMFHTKVKPQTIIALILVALLGLPSCFIFTKSDRLEKIESLIMQLEEGNEEAVVALADIGEPAVPALIEALGDENPSLDAFHARYHTRRRIFVAETLAKIGKPAVDAVPALIKALSDIGGTHKRQRLLECTDWQR